MVWAPVQPPVAVQDVALVDDQLKVTLPLYAIVGDEAVKVTVGAGVTGATGAAAVTGTAFGATATVTDFERLPPVPVQDKLKVVELVKPDCVTLPEVGKLSDWLPFEPVQVLALVVDQFKVTLPP